MSVYTMTDYGVFTISGGALKAVVDAVTVPTTTMSGGGLFFLPVGEGQINFFKVVAA